MVVQTLAAQLQLPADGWQAQYTRSNTVYDHQDCPVAHLDYQSFEERQAFRLTRWLYAQVTTNTVRPGVLFNLATTHLVAQRVVLPGVSLLARLVARVRARTGRHVYRQLRTHLRLAHQQALEALLVVPAGEQLPPLEQLRTPPTRVSAPRSCPLCAGWYQVRAVVVGDILVGDLPEARLARLTRHAHLAWAQTLGRISEEQCLATLLVFVQALERTATGGILDLFDGLMVSLGLHGETKRQRERLRSLKDSDKAALVLLTGRAHRA